MINRDLGLYYQDSEATATKLIRDSDEVVLNLGLASGLCVYFNL